MRMSVRRSGIDTHACCVQVCGSIRSKYSVPVAPAITWVPAGGYLWPPAMEIALASVTGTLRIIALLLLIWVLLRLLRQRFGGGREQRDARWAPPEDRSKGEVRIERITRDRKDRNGDDPPVSDADFEEVK